MVSGKSLIVLQGSTRLEMTCNHLLVRFLVVHLSMIDSEIDDLFLFVIADREAGGFKIESEKFYIPRLLPLSYDRYSILRDGERNLKQT